MKRAFFAAVGGLLLSLGAARFALAGETITIAATDTLGATPAYVAKPPGSKPAPAVLVLHGCGGFGTFDTQAADTMAAAGYVGVAIDDFAAQGIKNACGDITGSRTQAKYARVALNWMASQPFVDPSKLAVVGFSMGAIATLDLVVPFVATPAPAGVVAAVAFYPACRRREPANVVAPILILDGSADDWTPAAPCQTFAQAAADATKPVSINTYPGATHAFNAPGPDRVYNGHHLHYDAADAADARQKMLDFLAKYLR